MAGQRDRLVFPVMAYRPIAPKQWMDDYGNVLGFIPTATVFERVAEPLDTGLFDIHGSKIYRITDPEPIGFHIGRHRNSPRQ